MPKEQCTCALAVHDTKLLLEGLEHLQEAQPNTEWHFRLLPLSTPNDPTDPVEEVVSSMLENIDRQCGTNLYPSPAVVDAVKNHAYGIVQKQLLNALAKACGET